MTEREKDPAYHNRTTNPASDPASSSFDEITVEAPRPAEQNIIGSERYRVRQELGHGGVGFVYLADDLQAGRVVALKVLNPKSVGRPDLVLRFVGEARITAQLDHPGIVPVYDIGNLPGGEPYYTMRVIRGNSLAHVLRTETRREYSLQKLLGILIQVSRTVGFAHLQGVVHRDLKPENILVGNYGEVYVTDWGLARALSEFESLPLPKNATRDGIVLGTPGYIAPEQITDASKATGAADLFSLGVVLYEMLTGALPFDEEDVHKTLLASLLHEPKRPRERNPRAPEALDELSLRCLAKDPLQRPKAEVLTRALEDFLEGTKEREKHREAARVQVENARAMQTVVGTLDQEAERLEREASRLVLAVNTHEDSPAKRHVWELEERAAQAKLEREEAFGELISNYYQALTHEPDNFEARNSLAAIYYGRVLEAEAARNQRGKIFFERLLKEHDDGTYAAKLSALAVVTLESTPKARIFARPYRPQHQFAILGEGKELGETPLRAELPAGSWLLTASAPGFVDAKIPCRLSPGGGFEASVELYTQTQLGKGFIHIPAGWATIGGDARAPGSLPKQRLWVEGFALAEKPVSYGEYSEFRQDLEKRNNEEVAGLPALGVSWFDAQEYCEWRTKRDGVTYRLPFENEWEKAARGADGRVYPWGDRFDPIFCKSRESRPGIPAPEPIGTFAADISPYGIVDLAGSAREWVADVLGDSDHQRILRGGGWNSTALSCRAAARFRISGRVRRLDFGFRLARSLRDS
jgi:serine/threonine-protein kinase